MKKGFTLVELLVVVIIVVLLVVFAVPSYKASQESSRNQRAQAILTDVASAVQSYKVYGNKNISGQITSDIFSIISYCMVDGATTDANAINCLAKDELLRPIPFESATGIRDTYLGYRFYVCPFSGSACCNAYPAAVAVMENTKTGGRFGSGKCAYVVPGNPQVQSDYDKTAAI